MPCADLSKYSDFWRIKHETNVVKSFHDWPWHKPSEQVLLAGDVQLANTINAQEDQGALQKEWCSSGELKYSQL